MFGEYDFKKDIVKGVYLEDIVKEMIFERCQDVKCVYTNKDDKYDLKILFNDNTYCTIEVKYDMMSAKTGNIAIETMCRGKYSGINKSIADYYIYGIFIENKLRIFILRRINLINELKKNCFKRVIGGDLYNGKPSTEMIILPIDYFIKISIEITNKNKFVFGIRKNK